MNTPFFPKLSITLLIFGVGFFSCSSSDDSPSSGNGNGDESSGNTQNVPDIPDSGKNNNSQPDNINPGNSGSGETSSWNLVFEDNFEGESSTPDSEYWSLAPKGDDTWNRHMSESYDQAFQKNGYLYLYGELKDGEYLTGGIETRSKFDFKYGQVKCRARFLRQPKGNHTGIWMMPQSQPEAWPRYGEIDIMEHINDEDQIFSTVHYWDESELKDASSQGKFPIDNEDFNVYGIVWNENAVTFTVNGEEIFSYQNDNPGNADFSYQYPFVRPFYLILSQSLGGEGTWEGAIDNSELPAIFQIDWIKVWQKD